MKFVYKRMYIHRDWLKITYHISNASFNIQMAKEICRAFENNDIVFSRIMTSYEEDLSNTPSFFDSYTKNCCVHNIDELTENHWSGSFQADCFHLDNREKERPILSLSARKHGSDISILYDISQNKLHLVPEAANDQELSVDELVQSLTAKPDSDDRKAFATAVAMVKSEWYDDAYQLLHKIGRDREAATLLPKDYLSQLAFEKGIMLRKKEKYEEAKECFAKAIDLKQAHAEIQETTYQQALQQLKQKNYQKAFDLLVEIVEYKNVRQLFQDKQLSNINAENMCKQSQIVLFGCNGDIPIPWIVLETRNGQSLLLSRYPLWCDSFHDIYEGVEWEHSSLCQKINTTFKKEAFNFEERSRILANEDPVNRIFLLNCSNKDYVERITIPFTKNDSLLFKSLDNGKHRLSRIKGWWLRDTKHPEPKAYYVLELDEEKRILDEGVKCTYWVRPAIWICTEEKRTFFGF